MSCLVMKKETTAELANYIAALLNMGFEFFQYSAPTALYDTTKDCVVGYCVSEKKLYEKLYRLNIAAYNGRYKDGHVSVDVPAIDDFGKYVTYERLTFDNHEPRIAPWHYRIAKLLEYWLYQTAEDATDKDEFMLAIVELRRTLFDFIVQHTDTYKSIEWFDI